MSLLRLRELWWAGPRVGGAGGVEGSPLCLRMRGWSLRMPTGSLERTSSLSFTGAEGPARGVPPRALPEEDPGLWASRCEMEAWGGQGSAMGFRQAPETGAG